MAKAPSDRCKLPRPFWQSLEQFGLRPSAVLRQARLPATLHLDNSAVISTVQLFAIWNAIETLSEDPTFSIRMVSETSTANHKLAILVASYAADFRDGMARLARFNRLCSPERLCFEELVGAWLPQSHPFQRSSQGWAFRGLGTAATTRGRGAHWPEVAALM
jgi:hypothetical protein